MNERKPNIDLLRILAMVFIVAHHLCVHGFFNNWHPCLGFLHTLNSELCAIGALGGKLGVDLFVIITGYFMISSNFKVEKPIKICLQTLIYSLIFLIIALICGSHDVPSEYLGFSLAPVATSAYWFITTYILLYILSPLLNNLITSYDKEKLNRYLALFFVLWCVVSIFNPNAYEFCSLGWFVFLYFVGASLRLKTFGQAFSNKKLFKILGSISFVVLILYAVFRASYIDSDLFRTQKIAHMNSFFIFSVAIYLFHLFDGLKIKSNKYISLFATSTLGVYLIHDNHFVRNFIWSRVFHCADYLDSPYFILYAPIVAVAVYVVCVIFDKLFQIVFGGLINKVCWVIKSLLLMVDKKCINRKI